MRALDDWLERSGIHTGAIFRPVEKGGRLADTTLTGDAVAQIVRGHVAVLGHDSRRFAAHSLRAGYCTGAIEGGTTEHSTMLQSRHRSTTVFRGYVRRGSFWQSHRGYSVDL